MTTIDKQPYRTGSIEQPNYYLRIVLISAAILYGIIYISFNGIL